ncbi:MAG TPA: hypothetical protein DCR35_05815 [Runella sp.]|nr:hypothetical protein [Runella sp.]HAO48840.1 hypothetical protein [Runella sp.]
MKILIGVLLLSITALVTCSDTQAAKKWTSKSAKLCTTAGEIETRKPELSETSGTSVKNIPPVGCALPMAELEEVVQQAP